MPTFVKSIRGNRLRVGTRTIVMAGNYARTMAILRNQEMKLALNRDAGNITVEPLYGDVPSPAESQSAPPPGPETTNDPPEATSSLPPVRISRQLDAVRIDSVTIDRQRDGSPDKESVIVYQSNGRCNPYEVRVVDEFGSAMIITVDAVASAKVRREGP